MLKQAYLHDLAHLINTFKQAGSKLADREWADKLKDALKDEHNRLTKAGQPMKG